MKDIFIILVSLLILLLIFCVVLTEGSTERISKVSRQLFLNALVTMCMYTFTLLIPYKEMAKAVSAFYFASIDWLLLQLIRYVYVFTEYNLYTKRAKGFRYFGIIVAWIDTISLLLNRRFEHAFTLSKVYTASNRFLCWTYEYKWPFNLHLIFCYLMVAQIVLTLTITTIKAPRLYRSKFLSILSSFLIVIIANAFAVFMKWQIDASVILYAGLTAAICYFTFFSIPKRIITDILKVVSENMNSGVACFDSDGNCIFTNRSFRRTYPDEENIGKYAEKHLQEWFSVAGASFERELILERDGRQNIYTENYYILKDKRGRLMGSYIKLDNRTEEITSLNQERYRVSHDALTGVLNRNYFFERATEVLLREPEVPRMFIATDIKDFKLINDLFGERVGDDILIQHAHMMQDANQDIKKGEQLFGRVSEREIVIGRISGDKFAMLIPKADFSEQVAHDGIKTIRNITDDVKYKVNVYFGIYEIRNVRESVQSMFDKAQMAIRANKRNYGPNVAFYDEKLMDQLLREKTILSEFEAAVKEQQFKILLQPIVDADNCVTGAEALVRWYHPKKGILAPDAFLGVLDDAGYAFYLDEYVWDTAAARLRKWQDAGIRDMKISVNVSHKDFYYTDLCGVFGGLIKKHGIDPSGIRIEITEDVFMHDIEFHMQVLNRLRDMGFTIEMDNFGTGYSSLNLLKDINVDIVRIDMKFMRETESESRSRIILEMIVGMAKQLGMQVVAEGIESAEQREQMLKVGCTLFQGYYFSKPVTVEMFEQKYLKEVTHD